MHEPSPTQKAYLARQKRDRRLVVSARLLVFLIFLAQWEILARAGWIDSFIFSSPSMIFKTFVEMAQNHSLFIHIGATLKETLLSFLFVVVLGLGISILLWGCPRLAKVLEPYLVVLNSLPKIALGPVIIIVVGAGTEAIIFMALAISLIVTVLEMLAGFRATNPESIKMARTFGATKRQVFTKIVFPSNINTLFNSLKINIGLSLVGVIAGEFLVSKAGLGYLIVYGGCFNWTS